MHTLAVTIGGWDITAQYVFRGFIEGLTYGMVAIGLVLIYKASGVINFAQEAVRCVRRPAHGDHQPELRRPHRDRAADRHLVRGGAGHGHRAPRRAAAVPPTAPAAVRGHARREPAHHVRGVPAPRAEEPAAARVPRDHPLRQALERRSGRHPGRSALRARRRPDRLSLPRVVAHPHEVRPERACRRRQLVGSRRSRASR